MPLRTAVLVDLLALFSDLGVVLRRLGPGLGVILKRLIPECTYVVEFVLVAGSQAAVVTGVVQHLQLGSFLLAVLHASHVTVDLVELRLVGGRARFFVFLSLQDGRRLSEVLRLAKLQEVVFFVQFSPLILLDVLVHSRLVFLPPCLSHHESFLLLLKLYINATKFVQALNKWHYLLLEWVLVITLYKF